MSRATTEAEGIADMQRHFAAGTLSGRYPTWQKLKHGALQMAHTIWNAKHRPGPMEIVDIGCGDLSHMAGWKPFTDASVLYTGVDCMPESVAAGRSRFPHHRFDVVPASEIPRTPHLVGADLLVCLDVLYHLPVDADHDALVEWIFDGAMADMVLISWSTGNDPGYTWFPRPLEAPLGWRRVHSASSSHAGMPQTMELFVAPR